MTCSGCKRRVPIAYRIWTDAHSAELKRLGWFLWRRGVEARFSGVLLCPECRSKPTNTDAYGRPMPTSELERLAG